MSIPEATNRLTTSINDASEAITAFGAQVASAFGLRGPASPAPGSTVPEAVAAFEASLDSVANVFGKVFSSFLKLGGIDPRDLDAGKDADVNRVQPVQPVQQVEPVRQADAATATPVAVEQADTATAHPCAVEQPAEVEQVNTATVSPETGEHPAEVATETASAEDLEPLPERRGWQALADDRPALEPADKPVKKSRRRS